MIEDRHARCKQDKQSQQPQHYLLRECFNIRFIFNQFKVYGSSFMNQVTDMMVLRV
jgi:hypothetical protein